MSTVDFEAITKESLYRSRGLKWMDPNKIGAFVAEMDYGIAPEIATAITEQIQLGQTGYLMPAMQEDMQNATSGWLADKFGWEVDPDRVRPLPDVLAALGAMMDHFVPGDSPVIVTTPAYMPFVGLGTYWGRPTVEVPLQYDGSRFVFDYDAIDKAFANGSELFILCNPYNPVGRVLEQDELEKICEIVDKHGGRVFNDEIHAPLVFDGKQHISYPSINETAANHSITAMSASKAWNLPGLKCAQLVLSNDADAEQWAKVGMMIEHGASTPGVLANTIAYRDAREWQADVRDYISENRLHFARLVSEMMPEAKFIVPEGTYLAWMDFTAYDLPSQPADFFDEKAGVILTPGLACGAVGDGRARLNLATVRPILTEIVERMADAVAKR